MLVLRRRVARQALLREPRRAHLARDAQRSVDPEQEQDEQVLQEWVWVRLRVQQELEQGAPRPL